MYNDAQALSANWRGVLVGLAIVGSVLAYVLYMKGLEQGIDRGVASISATIEPVVATALGVLIFRDALDAWQVLGMAVVLAGVVLPQAIRK